jgi:hypothetical protein
VLGDELQRPRLHRVRDVGAARLEHLGGHRHRAALLVPEVQEPGNATGGGISLVEGEQFRLAVRAVEQGADGGGGGEDAARAGLGKGARGGEMGEDGTLDWVD